jgi:hypothetical protein
MSRSVTTLVFACVLLALAGTAQAQWTPNPLGSVTVNIGAEASIRVDNSPAFSTSTTFQDYTATTNFTYKIRTATAATINLKVTTDFSGTGAPSVTTPVSTGDTLSYTCTGASPMSPNLTTTPASTAASTPVGTFAPNTHSLKDGTAGSVVWVLTNDPAYGIGSYTAVVTYTISMA